MSGSARRRRRQAGRVAIATAAVLAVGAATAAAGGFGLPGGQERSGTPRGLPPATAKVTRQTLVDTQTENGELGYGDATTVTGRLAGTVTGMPAAGTVLRRGQALYRLDNAPVVLLYGSLPAYRALSAGTKGPDVKQFERNLRALGYSGFGVDDEYTDATADAVKDWQDDLDLPETGTVALGRVRYADGPVRVDAQKAAVGDAVGPGTALLTYTGTSRVVTVELSVADQRLARRGAGVHVRLPSGRTVGGRIAKVTTVIDTGSDANAAPTTKIDLTVTIADQRALAGLDQAAPDVDFTASARTGVLTVPVAALLALAEGGYGVQVVEGATTRLVAVRTGLFAGGRVEVSGAGLTEGMTVGVPS